MSDSSDSEFGDLAAAINSVDSDQDELKSEDEEENQKSEDSESEVEKPSKKPKRKKIVNPDEQKELDKFLFGDKEGLLKNLEGNQVFFADTIGIVDGEDSRKNDSVWRDSDDEDFKANTEYGEIRNKRKFERIAGTPSWARLDKKNKVGDDSSDDDGEISKTVGHLAKKVKSKELDKKELGFKRLAHINKTTTREGRITSILFHPSSTVGIVAGLKGMVSMFSIDGRENKKVKKRTYWYFEILIKNFSLDSQRRIRKVSDSLLQTQ